MLMNTLTCKGFSIMIKASLDLLKFNIIGSINKWDQILINKMKGFLIQKLKKYKTYTKIFYK